VSVPTLQEVAERREELRLTIEAQQAEVERLRAPYEAARARLSDSREEMERVELALHSAKRAHLIVQAVQEAGLATAEPPLIVVPKSFGLPEVYELTALTGDGLVGLYVHSPERKSRGKTRAVRARWVPAEVLEAIDELGWTDKCERLAELGITRGTFQRGGGKVGHGQSLSRVYDSEDLVEWQEQGTGDYGYGSGPWKPLSPPNGGKWRWLKVREQEELGVAADA
jgi:hypothetical protein